MAVQIKSIEHLKKESEKGAEFFILLGKTGSYRSTKWIFWDPDEKMFFIRNLIDESEQELSERQIMNRGYTNIGYAITKGALFLDE